MTIKMFLRDNFIHGDLHAGNLLFDQRSGRITVMDAGLVTEILPDRLWDFGEFLKVTLLDHLILPSLSCTVTVT